MEMFILIFSFLQISQAITEHTKSWRRQDRGSKNKIIENNFGFTYNSETPILGGRFNERSGRQIEKM